MSVLVRITQNESIGSTRCLENSLNAECIKPRAATHMMSCSVIVILGKQWMNFKKNLRGWQKEKLHLESRCGKRPKYQSEMCCDEATNQIQRTKKIIFHVVSIICCEPLRQKNIWVVLHAESHPNPIPQCRWIRSKRVMNGRLWQLDFSNIRPG